MFSPRPRTPPCARLQELGHAADGVLDVAERVVVAGVVARLHRRRVVVAAAAQKSNVDALTSGSVAVARASVVCPQPRPRFKNDVYIVMRLYALEYCVVIAHTSQNDLALALIQPVCSSS